MKKRILCAVMATVMAMSLLTACDNKANDSPIPEQYQPVISDESEEGGEEPVIDADIIKSTLTSTDDGNGNFTNPVIFADVPDVDFIRVGDTLQMNYYGLHFMGYRYAIFNYATMNMGGYVDVDFFRVSDTIIR